MYLKTRNKIIRKYDSDFWNIIYTRKRKNKFFAYFKLSLINKLQFLYKRQFFFLSKNKLLRVQSYKSSINSLNKKFTFLKNFRKFFKKVNFLLKEFFLN